MLNFAAIGTAICMLVHYSEEQDGFTRKSANTAGPFAVLPSQILNQKKYGRTMKGRMIEEIRIMILYRSAPNRSANSWILKTGRMETQRARRSLSKGLRRLRQPFRLYDPCALCVSKSIFIETEEIGQNAKKTRSDRQQLPELDIVRKTAHDISPNQSCFTVGEIE